MELCSRRDAASREEYRVGDKVEIGDGWLEDDKANCL